MRNVFSLDLTSKRALTDNCPLTRLKGLKLRTAVRIRFTVEGREWSSTPRQFTVALTNRGSLLPGQIMSSRCCSQLTFARC